MIQYKGYIGKVEFDPEAKMLHGEVIGIRDVVTFQGESVDEIQKAFRESVDDYLEFCVARGEAPDKPFSGHFVVRIAADLHRKLDMLAQAEGKSLNAYVSETLSHGVSEKLSQPRPKRGNNSTGPRKRKAQHTRSKAA